MATTAKFADTKEIKSAKESEAWFGLPKKQPKKKRERKRGAETETFLNFPIEMLNFFSLSGIKVPTKSEELAESIDEIKKKRDHLNSLEERTEEKKPRSKENKAKEERKQNELKPTDFPEPLESQHKQDYGIFVDDGHHPKAEDVKPTRGRGSYKRGRN